MSEKATSNYLGYYCKHCGKLWEYHNAKTRCCPLKGSRGNFKQYTNQVFELNPKRKRKTAKFVL